ncbi:MAG: hypothetical protein JOZ60_10420, partial [Verrucomicrobia bacterium]|nr:hypothetical protein [Verrucomicrobiota bacterium]
LTVAKPTDKEQEPDLEKAAQGHPEIIVVPCLGEGDEVVGRILGRLLETEAIGTRILPWRTLRAEKIQRLKELEARWVVLSAIESRSAISVGKMAYSIQRLLPDAVIFVGLWSLPKENAARSVRKIKESSGTVVSTNLHEALRGIIALISAAEKESAASVETA